VHNWDARGASAEAIIVGCITAPAHTALTAASCD
jgi:hypothetical protein